MLSNKKIVEDDIFDEYIYYALLQNINISRVRVDQLTRLALQHIHHALDICNALRKALYQAQDVNSEFQQGIWYVLDSLLKHAPMVFLPLVMSELYEWVVHRMAWNTLRLHIIHAEETNNANTKNNNKNNISELNVNNKIEEIKEENQSLASEEAEQSSTIDENANARKVHNAAEKEAEHSSHNDKSWFERLIFSWSGLLPSDVYEPIREYVIRVRSEATLTKNLMQTNNKQANLSSSSSSVESVNDFRQEYNGNNNSMIENGKNNNKQQEKVIIANPIQLHELQDEWESFKYLCSTKLQPQYDFMTEMLDSLAHLEKMKTNSVLYDKEVDNELKKSGYHRKAEMEHNTTNKNNNNSIVTVNVCKGDKKAKILDGKEGKKEGGDYHDENEEEEEDDEEYNPEFVAGAVARELPKVELPAFLRRKRRRNAEQRRRREEEEM